MNNSRLADYGSYTVKLLFAEPINTAYRCIATQSAMNCDQGGLEYPFGGGIWKPYVFIAKFCPFDQNSCNVQDLSRTFHVPCPWKFLRSKENS